MTEVAAPYTETDPRRRAEENITNQTVRGFADEVNKHIWIKLEMVQKDIQINNV